MDAERRFEELEKETKKLHSESKKYFDSINGRLIAGRSQAVHGKEDVLMFNQGMLNHQIEFSKACAELYLPISGRVSDPDSFVQEGNPEGIRACEEYEGLVRDLQNTLQPELEMIETRVIRPADELLEVIKIIRKTAQKRDHKQLDYDRHKTTHKKLVDKKEKTLKDEKALYKAESDVEQATQDYEYFNNLLKEELPRLFQLEREFIRPLFQSFYYMQLNVFYTLHEKMQAIDIGYFDLTLGIEDSFERKRGDVQQQIEAIPITHFKTTGGKAPRGTSKYAIGNKPSQLAIEGRTRRSTLDSSDQPPPPYSAGATGSGNSMSHAMSVVTANSGVGRANSTGSSWGSAAKAKGAAPPPPKPKPSKFAGAPVTETVTALYDYEAQAEGDLSFSVGDIIEIVSRTSNENEWWQGKVNGRQGQFPGE